MQQTSSRSLNSKFSDGQVGVHAMVLVNFSARVYYKWVIVEQKLAVLTVGAGGGWLDIFFHLSPLS